jgi:hypothetical protein
VLLIQVAVQLAPRPFQLPAQLAGVALMGVVVLAVVPG